jgi:hypothetical protein
MKTENHIIVDCLQYIALLIFSPLAEWQMTLKTFHPLAFYTRFAEQLVTYEYWTLVTNRFDCVDRNTEKNPKICSLFTYLSHVWRKTEVPSPEGKIPSEESPWDVSL